MRALPVSLTASLDREGRDLTLLVIRLGAMGDILRTLPAVRLLRRALPSSRILWVLEEQWGGLLERHPDVDDLVLAPRKAWDRLLRSPQGWWRLPASLGRFRRALRDAGAGLALDFHGNLRSGMMGWLSAAPVRLGYEGHQQKEGNRLFSTHRVASGDRRTPRMARNLSLVSGLRIAVDPLPRTELPMLEAGAARADAILTGQGPTAVVSPGASAKQAYKKPPAELLAAACRRLGANGIRALVVHGPGEENDARRVVAAAGDAARLAPPTDLPTLAALLGRARLFVGGDTGPLHMACAVGCPVLGVYGPTDPRVNEPWGVPWRSVFPADRRYTGIKRIDRQAGGFTGLRAESVEDAVQDLLEETGGHGPGEFG